MLIAETKTPPAGWNSFDCYMGSINEEQALANLELFLKKLKPAGYEYFCLDATSCGGCRGLRSNGTR